MNNILLSIMFTIGEFQGRHTMLFNKKIVNWNYNKLLNHFLVYKMKITIEYDIWWLMIHWVLNIHREYVSRTLEEHLNSV